MRAEEAAAIGELGLATLRRLKTGDPAAPGWPVIARLLRLLDAVNAGLDSPPTPHRRRAMLDVVALVLTRCAQPGAGSYWDWPAERWEAMLGRTVAEFRAAAPPWVGDEVRPYLAAHAFLLGGFTAFHRLGSFQRLVLCWRLPGSDRATRRPLPRGQVTVGAQDALEEVADHEGGLSGVEEVVAAEPEHLVALQLQRPVFAHHLRVQAGDSRRRRSGACRRSP
ncbi:hypothetical protein L3i22_059890 [Actinoplanes sp. L3-i22]|nr:hypothetical protein L3i22_059890 [Actinoplanes sp. L3-i22]